MSIDSVLIAIATFFSVAHLTCVVTVPNCKSRLDDHFMKWYFITIAAMYGVTFYLSYSSTESPKVSEIADAAMESSYFYIFFLAFVYMFNSKLSDKIESTKA